jgi:hypothetical protein
MAEATQPASASRIGHENEYDFAHSNEAEQDRFYLGLNKRVRSFNNNTLHSSAYLSYLTKYLRVGAERQQRYRSDQMESSKHYQQSLPFVFQYNITRGREPALLTFETPEAYARTMAPIANELIFLGGRPSAEWLNCIGSRYNLDYRFFHQHLGPLLSRYQRDWYAIPDLPSRSLQILRLRVPSIVFIGPSGRNVSISNLEAAREDCRLQLQNASRSLQNSRRSETGTSIIRRVDIFCGSVLVIEQEITAICVQRGANWTGKFTKCLVAASVLIIS